MTTTSSSRASRQPVTRTLGLPLPLSVVPAVPVPAAAGASGAETWDSVKEDVTELAGTAAGLSGATQLGFGALSSVIMGWLVPVWPLSLVAAMLIWVLLGWAALTFLVGRR